MNSGDWCNVAAALFFVGCLAVILASVIVAVTEAIKAVRRKS